ncbi:FGFR1 oncogene partner [Galemys pyrenaicus]|uniref:Centrosomal protein 43 n=1 Tax=Galemys pyrenaicus TaxID=202257 RepID=A0A8J6DFR9_GALPY|nr:FGFR1 oncogene partner [Galemys pyrenaicus]
MVPPPAWAACACAGRGLAASTRRASARRRRLGRLSWRSKMAATAPAVVPEEDTELRDLLVQTLESNGVLNRIKAELRAAVFLALEEQEKVELARAPPLSRQNKTPLVNESLRKFLTTRDGRLVASLVAEFLQFFNLDFTLAVFQPETSTLHGLEGRENLARDLGIIEAEGTVGGPLLLEVIRRCQHKEQAPSTGEVSRARGARAVGLGAAPQGAPDLSDLHSPPRSPEGRAGAPGSPSKIPRYTGQGKKTAGGQRSGAKTAAREAGQSDSSLSSEPRSRGGLHPKAQEPRTGPLPGACRGLDGGDRAPLRDDGAEADPFFDGPVPEPEQAYGRRGEPGRQAGGLASLADAPPRRSGPGALAGTLSLPDCDGTAEEDDYVDDFTSTSHCSEKSQPSAGEEVEEELSVGADELSSSDKLDDLTQDLTVSQLSDAADYLEDVA